MDQNLKLESTETRERAEWVRPVLFRMDAADAERNNFTFPDAANGTMMAS